MQRYDEALADLNRAIELDPADASALASRGHTYLVMKRYGRSMADLKRGLKLVVSDWASQDRGP